MTDNANLLSTTAREIDDLLAELAAHLEDRLRVTGEPWDRALLEAVETWRLSTR